LAIFVKIARLYRYCFYVLIIKRNFKTTIKDIIVNKDKGNRGKFGVGGIWRYGALKKRLLHF